MDSSDAAGDVVTLCVGCVVRLYAVSTRSISAPFHRLPSSPAGATPPCGSFNALGADAVNWNIWRASFFYVYLRLVWRISSPVCNGEVGGGATQRQRFE